MANGKAGSEADIADIAAQEHKLRPLALRRILAPAAIAEKKKKGSALKRLVKATRKKKSYFDMSMEELGQVKVR
jgi:hypothetical protein